MMPLSELWRRHLVDQPETGMGYQIATVRLRSGAEFPQTVIIDGAIASIRGYTHIPFAESDIAEIVVTHSKWDWEGSG